METIKDILAEMREHSNEMTPPQIIFNEDGGIDMTILADRIEKAYANCNQSKLREALDKIQMEIKVYDQCLISTQRLVDAIEEIIEQALSAPPRNCDVGTAEDQAKRFDDFCNSHMYNTNYKNCGNCPLWSSGTIGKYCELRWSQMSYESEESEVSNDKN